MSSGVEVDIPYCTKYIILACYLASVIPPSHDEYLFSAFGKKSDLTKVQIEYWHSEMFSS